MQKPPVSIPALLLFLAIPTAGCPKRPPPEEPPRYLEVDLPEDEDLDDLPESGDTGDDDGGYWEE